MKRTFPNFLCLLLCFGFLTSSAQNWTSDFNAAQKLAQTSKQNILLNFSGSDWCGPCIRMKKELFGSDGFKNYANKNLILVNADFPRYKKNRLSEEQTKHNEMLAEKYNPKGSFPLTILFNKDGKILKSWVGYPPITTDEFISQLKTFEAAPASKSQNLRSFSKQKVLMGSAFSITVVEGSWDSANVHIEDAFNHIAQIESLISSWDANSQTSLINKSAGINPVQVDAELFGLIERSKKISELTQGAFDISFGSVHKGIWKFDGSMTSWPDSARVTESIQLIDYRNIILDHEKQTVFLKDSGMRIGFGGIGKGYAARQTAEHLKSLGVKAGVVNAGGDLYCWGAQDDGSPWKISVADPDNKNRAISQLELMNMAAVTSGNYEKFIEIDGQKYCHILDPRTGYPVKHLKSVTVITKDPELADALATSVFVLGPEVGLDLINQLNGVECLIIDEKDQIHASNNLNLNEQ